MSDCGFLSPPIYFCALDCTPFLDPFLKSTFIAAKQEFFNEDIVVEIHRADFVLLLKKVHLVEAIFLEWFK